ncbi:hypothetical protein IGJ55_002395 [Enterococcus sp. AZ170]
MLKRKNKLRDYLIFYLYKLVILLFTLLISWLLISKIEFLNDSWQVVTTHFTEWSYYEDKFELAIVTLIVVSLAALGVTGMFFIYWGIEYVLRFILVRTRLCHVQEQELEARISDKVVASYRPPGGGPNVIVEECNLNLEIDGDKKMHKLTVPYDLFEILEKGQMIQVIESKYSIFGSCFDKTMTLKAEQELDSLED